MSSVRTVYNSTYSCLPGFIEDPSTSRSNSVVMKSRHPELPNAPHSVLMMTWNRQKCIYWAELRMRP